MVGDGMFFKTPYIHKKKLGTINRSSCGQHAQT